MGFDLGKAVRVKIEVEDNDIYFQFPSYTDPRMHDGIKKLCSSRVPAIRAGRRTQRLDLHGPREKFFDDFCEDVEGVELGGEVLNAASDPEWKTKIPVQWKYTVASYFEEGEALTAEDVKNS